MNENRPFAWNCLPDFEAHEAPRCLQLYRNAKSAPKPRLFEIKPLYLLRSPFEERKLTGGLESPEQMDRTTALTGKGSQMNLISLQNQKFQVDASFYFNRGVVVVDEQGQEVADVAIIQADYDAANAADDAGQTPRDFAQKRARMMAASPRLLAACLAVEDLLAGYDQTPEESKVWQQLQDAIKGATDEWDPRTYWRQVEEAAQNNDL